MTKLSLGKVESFIKDLDEKPELKQEFEANPKATLKRIASLDTPIKDIWVYRLVVTALSLVVLIVVIGLLIKDEKEVMGEQVFTIINSLASLSIGALAGLLAPSPGKQDSE
ncbi:hypothetical protein ASU31_21350 [Pedobacter ginsenosidimutans]|uniref:Uncharacterized protein n=1 Tax=Pedobacter ginsenosidimutans TaxID=687842 RepID=A0A0T5VJP1_9SPHI|nr:hypothetical protein [Pedobacter ginsenosidimutans]KRT14070.1 hypothetical protein ASU31_21350 [Pedobacter ginsenosidimutans]